MLLLSDRVELYYNATRNFREVITHTQLNILFVIFFN